MKITYRRNDWTVHSTTETTESMDHSSLAAQKFMTENREVVAAQIADGTTERTVNRATTWQKLN